MKKTRLLTHGPMRYLDRDVGLHNDQLLEIARVAVNKSPEPRYQIKDREERLEMEEKERLGVTFNKTLMTSLKRRMEELEKLRLEFLKDIVSMNDQISDDLRRYDEQLSSVVVTRITSISLDTKIQQMVALMVQLTFYKNVLEAKIIQYEQAKDFIVMCTEMQGFARPPLLIDRYAALRHIYEELYQDYENKMGLLNKEQDRLSELVSTKTNENMELLNQMASMHLQLKQARQTVSEYERAISERIDNMTGSALEVFRVKNAIFNTYSSIMTYRGFELTHHDPIDQLQQLETRLLLTIQVVDDFLTNLFKKSKHRQTKLGKKKASDLHGEFSGSSLDDTSEEEDARMTGKKSGKSLTSVDSNVSHSQDKIEEGGDSGTDEKRKSFSFGCLPPIAEETPLAMSKPQKVDPEERCQRARGFVQKAEKLSGGRIKFKRSRSLPVKAASATVPVKINTEAAASKREKRLSEHLFKQMEIPKRQLLTSRKAHVRRKELNISTNKSPNSVGALSYGQHEKNQTLQGQMAASTSAKASNKNASMSFVNFPRTLTKSISLRSGAKLQDKTGSPACTSQGHPSYQRLQTIPRESSPGRHHDAVNREFMAFETTADVEINRLKRERLRRLLLGDEPKPFGSKFPSRSSFVERWNRFGKFKTEHASLPSGSRNRSLADIRQPALAQSKSHKEDAKKIRGSKSSLDSPELKKKFIGKDTEESTADDYEVGNLELPALSQDKDVDKALTRQLTAYRRKLLNSLYSKKLRDAKSKKKADKSPPMDVFFIDPSKPKINIGYNKPTTRPKPATSGEAKERSTEASSVSHQVKLQQHTESLRPHSRQPKRPVANDEKSEAARQLFADLSDRRRMKTDYLNILSRVKIRKELRVDDE